MAVTLFRKRKIIINNRVTITNKPSPSNPPVIQQPSSQIEEEKKMQRQMYINARLRGKNYGRRTIRKQN